MSESESIQSSMIDKFKLGDVIYTTSNLVNGKEVRSDFKFRRYLHQGRTIDNRAMLLDKFSDQSILDCGLHI